MDNILGLPKLPTRALIPAVALAMVIAATVTIGVSGSSAVASTTPLAPLSGEITAVQGGCLNNSGGTLSMHSCDGNFGEQLWTIEADQTIRIWGFDYPPGATSWSASPEQCLKTKSSDNSIVLANCDGSASSPDQYEQWQLHQDNGTNKNVLLYNRGSNRCLTTALQVVSCTNGDSWNMPAPDSFHEAATNALALQAMYDSHTSPDQDNTGGLFADTNNQQCQLNGPVYGGNCWWWSSVAMDGMIHFLEQANSASWTGLTSLQTDVSNTYKVICNRTSAGCPTATTYQTNSNMFQNYYNDDTSHWGLTWLNAYELSTGTGVDGTPYRHLADNLWYYVTNNGWDKAVKQSGGTITGSYPRSCGPGGMWQQNDGTTGTSGKDPYNTSDYKNLGTNALYLWLSAWLYTVTDNPVYFDGLPGSASPSGTYGGAAQEANWLIGSESSPGALVQPYNQIAIDQPGARFLFNGHVDPDSTPACQVAKGQQKETQHMGMVVAALNAMSAAIAEAHRQQMLGNTANVPASVLNSTVQSQAFYLAVGDNLAQTIMDPTVSPMLDGNQILSETCASDPNTTWPDGCDVNPNEGSDGDESSSNPEQINPVWLPGKGIVMRGMSCLNNSQPDSTISNFIASNATSVWTADQNTETGNTGAQDLNQFGFLWDKFKPGPSNGWGYATQGSALEALDASLGGSALNC